MTSRDLASLKPEIQERLWESVIRVSTCKSRATGIVIEEHENSIFILTSLNFWADVDDLLDLKSQYELEELRELRTADISNSFGKDSRPTIVIDQLVDRTLKEVRQII